MPTPITHVVLGKKIHQHFFPHLDFPSFIIGTSFPDIHHITQLIREQTHLQDIHLKNINTQDAFLAGFQTHSLVDLVVNKDNRFQFYQDKILYPKINNWPEIASFLSQPQTQKVSFNISSEDIDKWYTCLQKLFLNGPNSQGIKLFCQMTDQPQNLPEYSNLLKEYGLDPNTEKQILKLLENIISLAKKE